MLRRPSSSPRFVPAFRSLNTHHVLEQAEAVPPAPNLRVHVKDNIARIDSQKGISPFLVDTFNRRHNYLRISLTERCNLRCFYCMPSDGVELSPQEHILTDDEVLRLATLFVKSGVTKIRLTGGEPTVRKGITNIVSRLNELREVGLESIGMTSNGIALHRKLPSLIENGLTHLNISLDTLDPFKFEIMTRRMGYEAVLQSLESALSSKALSVKLNVVIIKGLNDNEVLDFLELTKEQDVSVRFIEFMPFAGNKWDKAKMVPSSELLARIATRHPCLVKASDELNDTARSYIIPGYRGSFGFISSMSDHFCGSCNRLRLTADGQIKVCLFDAKEISLRDRLRSGADDAELLHTIGLAVRGKQEKHAGMEDIDIVTNRPMILIGDIHDIYSRRRPSQWLFRSQSYRFRPIHHAPAVLHSFMSSALQHGSGKSQMPPRLTHVDESGRASMVDVSSKDPSKRTATASGRIVIPRVAYELITSPDSANDAQCTSASPGAQPVSPLEEATAKVRSKGDVLTVAQLAAIIGCKRTSDLIPLCHPLQLSHISVTLHPEAHRPALGVSMAAEENFQEAARSDVGLARQAPAHIEYSIVCRAKVSCEGKTGVEMEALTAVSVGLLTVWDMLKAVAGKDMIIGDILVTSKYGGKSGDFERSDHT